MVDPVRFFTTQDHGFSNPKRSAFKPKTFNQYNILSSGSLPCALQRALGLHRVALDIATRASLHLLAALLMKMRAIFKTLKIQTYHT